MCLRKKNLSARQFGQHLALIKHRRRTPLYHVKELWDLRFLYLRVWALDQQHWPQTGGKGLREMWTLTKTFNIVPKAPLLSEVWESCWRQLPSFFPSWLCFRKGFRHATWGVPIHVQTRLQFSRRTDCLHQGVRWLWWGWGGGHWVRVVKLPLGWPHSGAESHVSDSASSECKPW